MSKEPRAAPLVGGEHRDRDVTVADPFAVQEVWRHVAPTDMEYQYRKVGYRAWLDRDIIDDELK